MLTTIKNYCIDQAGLLGNYEEMTVDELANGYCEASDGNDTVKKNQYIAALMLKFWHRIPTLYRATITANDGNDLDDFFSIMYLRFEYAFKYRAWQDASKNINAQSCINRALSTEIKNIFYFSNLDKNKANSNTLSLDRSISDDDDKVSFIDTIIAPEDPANKIDSDGTVNAVVQYYLDKNKIVEAIILDQLSFNNTSREVKTTKSVIDEETGKTKRITEKHSEFWPHACIEILSNLPVNFEKDFKDRYRVKALELAAAVNVIRQAPNPKLYRYLRKTLEKAKTELAKFKLTEEI